MDDTWNTPFERRFDGRDLGRAVTECYKGKGVRLLITLRNFFFAVSKVLQTPVNNFWSMNEFAVGGSSVAGPDDEPEDSTEGELSDSSTVESELSLVDTEGLGILLVEPLVDPVSQD